MTVAVIILADQHTTGLYPLVIGISADILSTRHKALIRLACQQSTEIIVQPTTAVMTFVYHGSLPLTVLITQQVTIHPAETGTVHGSYMHIGYLTSREFFHFLLITLHPTVIQQVRTFSCGDRFYRYIKATAIRIKHTHTYRFSGLSLQQWVVVHILRDRFAIYLLDDTASLHIGLLHGERSFGNHLINLNAITPVGIINEHTQVSGSQTA